MKKKSLFVTCLLLALSLIAMLCACSSFGGIRSAFENAGYEEVDLSEELQSILNAGDGEYEQISDVITLHTFKGKSILDVAFIAEFNSTEEMEKALKDHVTAQDAQNIYDELQKLDTVNGNCFYLFGTNSESLKIFKGTK